MGMVGQSDGNKDSERCLGRNGIERWRSGIIRRGMQFQEGTMGICASTETIQEGAILVDLFKTPSMP